MKKAVLSNYLWIPKRAVRGAPSAFAPEWETSVRLLSTPEGRLAQQQIAAMREQAVSLGLDKRDLPPLIQDEDTLPIVGWSEVGAYWALCCGDEAAVSMLVERLGLDLVDKRTDAPWPKELADFKMIMGPRPNQIEPFERWRKAGYGIFKAAPAFGKTLIMLWLISVLRQYTIVLVHTDGLASQFINRFRHGSPRADSSDFDPITNCLEIEGRLGRPIIGRMTSPDMEPFPVTVSTWQTFLPLIKSGRDLRPFTSRFGRLLADEAHTFASKAAFQTINLFPCRRLAATATPERKDQLHKGLHYILGPVTAVGKSDQIPVRAFFIQTNTVYKAASYPRRGEWAFLLNYLVKQADRNDKIVEWVQHDLNLGRTLLLSCDRMRWCFDMAERLCRLGIAARAIVGKSHMRAREREHLVSEALAGRISVLCATQAFKIGLDIPTLDTLYCVLPMSNTGGLEQLLGRIRRPRAGREFATFRYFVDDGSGLLRGCARSTHRDVSELGADVIVVPEWHKPAETVDTTKTRSKLRKIAARDPWLFNQAFFNSAAPTSERAYVRRMGERDED